MDDLNSECGQEIKRRIIDMVHEMAHDGVIWSRDHTIHTVSFDWFLSSLKWIIY